MPQTSLLHYILFAIVEWSLLVTLGWDAMHVRGWSEQKMHFAPFPLCLWIKLKGVVVRLMPHMPSMSPPSFIEMAQGMEDL